MKIAFILHDFSLTGAPKIGLDMAAIMARRHDVSVVSKKEGPLRAYGEQIKFRDMRVIPTSHEYEHFPLADRVGRYKAYLEEVKPDYVYVNSLASADWAPASHEMGIPFAVHSHEMRVDVLSLLGINLFRAGDLAPAHLLVAASEECARDTRRELRLGTKPIYDFGVGIDCEAVADKAKEKPPRAVNAKGRVYEWMGTEGLGRKRVVMCGVACERKGTDLFWQVARNCPDVDFIWVGPWDDDIARGVNPALALNKKDALANVYWTNMVANPYPALSASDLFLLSSRDDPNPLVVPEAISLGVPTCTFADTGGSRVWTERYGFSLAGKIDAERMTGFVKRFFQQDQSVFSIADDFKFEADIHQKMKKLLALIEESR